MVCPEWHYPEWHYSHLVQPDLIGLDPVALLGPEPLAAPLTLAQGYDARAPRLDPTPPHKT